MLAGWWWCLTCGAAACVLCCGLCVQVADALQQPFPDNSFDLVWSMVSGAGTECDAAYIHPLQNHTCTASSPS